MSVKVELSRKNLPRGTDQLCFRELCSSTALDCHLLTKYPFTFSFYFSGSSRRYSKFFAKPGGFRSASFDCRNDGITQPVKPSPVVSFHGTVNLFLLQSSECSVAGNCSGRLVALAKQAHTRRRRSRGELMDAPQLHWP